jgi:hypothetical protein
MSQSDSEIIDFTKPMVKCERCGKLITLAPESSRHEDAHPFRLAKEPKGVCANCIMTQFLYNTYPINMQIDEAGPELLLNQGIREAFVRCGLLSHSDLKIEEINWQQVVANWALPVKAPRGPRNPYRMGESPRAQARNAGLPPPAMYVPSSQEALAEIGKEEYCPKCGHPTSTPEGRAVFEQCGTDCQGCGFKSRASVWLRDLPLRKEMIQ